DLIRLCEHPDAGDVVALGWCAGRAPLSFVRECGGRGGMGPRETGAFALLPREAPVFPAEQAFLRPRDLRDGVRRWLARAEGPKPKTFGRLPAKSLRIVTYNVHSCVGLDGRLSPARIARVLARCDADVIAIQELDVL